MIPDSKTSGNLVTFLKQLKQEGVPKEEYPRKVSQFLESQAWLESIPLNGNFELTPLCNLNCRMCYVHLDGESGKNIHLLTTEQWKSLIDQAAASGMRKAVLTGGECLTYPGFDDIYLHLLEMGTRVTILTNGVLLDRKRIDFFKSHLPHEIHVTLYGSCDEVYERVTGKAVFDTVWNNLQLAKKEGLPVSLMLTPNRFMESDAEQLIEKAHSLGLSYTINVSLFDPRENTGRNGAAMDASLDTYVCMYRKKMQLEGNPCEPMELVSSPKNIRTGDRKSGLTCGGGRSMFQISWDGEMYPCTNLRLFHANPLDDGFEASWKMLNQAVKNVDLPKECDGCSYAELCGPCVVPHIHNGKTNRCNPEYCRRARRFVSEGIYRFPSIES